MSRIGSSPASARLGLAAGTAAGDDDTGTAVRGDAAGAPWGDARVVEEWPQTEPALLRQAAVCALAAPARFGGASHVGLVRPHNEDAWCFDASLGLAVLADGMGGYNAGEVASGIAVEQVRAELERALLAGEAPAVALQSALLAANRAIIATAARRPECAGLGTTVVAIVARTDGLWFASVGDSRLYRYRGGRLEQLTRDDTLVRALGEADPSAMERIGALGCRGVLTRALGVDAGLEVEARCANLAAGDLLLLCSDGLTDMLSDAAIAAELGRRGRETPASIAAALLQPALAAGGLDNVTAVVAQVADRQGR
ncbi:MAG: serine/threonine-protein phosphatase [Burkholderiales bacterium]|nr:MAG: serine/threonine-protein phosphatase [Burkholderiales bacterium]